MNNIEYNEKSSRLGRLDPIPSNPLRQTSSGGRAYLIIAFHGLGQTFMDDKPHCGTSEDGRSWASERKKKRRKSGGDYRQVC